MLTSHCSRHSASPHGLAEDSAFATTEKESQKRSRECRNGTTVTKNIASMLIISVTNIILLNLVPSVASFGMFKIVQCFSP